MSSINLVIQVVSVHYLIQKSCNLISFDDIIALILKNFEQIGANYKLSQNL